MSQVLHVVLQYSYYFLPNTGRDLVLKSVLFIILNLLVIRSCKSLVPFFTSVTYIFRSIEQYISSFLFLSKYIFQVRQNY